MTVSPTSPAGDSRPTITCTCGGAHPDDARYYVSVVDAGRVGLLAGPFASHVDALSLVEPARAMAERRDPWSHFYAFGTVAMPSDCAKVGLFNAQLTEAR